MTQRVRGLVFAITVVSLFAATSARAGQGGQSQGQQPAPPSDQPPAFEEQVVVTASRVEEQLVNAPAAVSVINSATIQNSPATNIGDLLRAVPGVNVRRVWARAASGSPNLWYGGSLLPNRTSALQGWKSLIETIPSVGTAKGTQQPS